MPPPPDQLVEAEQQLWVRTMDNVTDGSISRLAISHSGVQCWKSESNLQPPGFRLQEAPVQIDLGISSRSPGTLIKIISESLRLDELVYVEVNGEMYEKDVWAALGNLPRIEELKVAITEDLIAIKALCPHSPAHQVFPALTTLTISRWDYQHSYLLRPWCLRDESKSSIPTTEKLLHCAKLRAQAGMPLKMLKIERCRGVERKDVTDLRGEIDEVYCDAYID
ncbi:hypothetical protein H0H92_015056 [Tricholoma furcatifolium]|nr:hypothetical protein H0H92_015056 [Tricholoma furcatifolium]